MYPQPDISGARDSARQAVIRARFRAPLGDRMTRESVPPRARRTAGPESQLPVPPRAARRPLRRSTNGSPRGPAVPRSRDYVDADSEISPCSPAARRFARGGGGVFDLEDAGYLEGSPRLGPGAITPADYALRPAIGAASRSGTSASACRLRVHARE